MVVLLGKAFPRAPLAGDSPRRRCEGPALMRPAHIRVLAACLISGGSLSWGLVSGPQGIPAASALTTAAAALTALSSQCEPLPTAASASPSASPSTASSSNPTELCVSVQPSQSSIKPGQAASYTVQVSTENGPASGVSVTLTATPQGQQPEFASLCPSGNGTAACTIGSLGTTVSPSAYQMQAQIQVASTATSVTSVTLTATADAATTPAMTTMPAAAATVTVSAPAASPSTSPASTTRASTPRASTPRATTTPARVTPAILPALASTPALATVPTVSTPAINPVNISSALPVITPAANPAAAGAQPSPAANVSTPAAGNFTVVIGMSAKTAQLFGLIAAWLVVLLVATKLVGDHLAARRAQKKKEAGPETEESAGTGKKRFWFWRPGHPARPRRWRAAPRHASQHGREAQFDIRALGPGPDRRRLIRGQVVQDHEEPVAAGPGGPGGSQRDPGVTAVFAAPDVLAAPDHAPQQEPWIYQMP
jgi:hypothetical protein